MVALRGTFSSAHRSHSADHSRNSAVHPTGSNTCAAASQQPQHPQLVKWANNTGRGGMRTSGSDAHAAPRMHASARCAHIAVAGHELQHVLVVQAALVLLVELGKDQLVLVLHRQQLSWRYWPWPPMRHHLQSASSDRILPQCWPMIPALEAGQQCTCLHGALPERSAVQALCSARACTPRSPGAAPGCSDPRCRTPRCPSRACSGGCSASSR